MAKAKKHLRLTLIKSPAGRISRHRACVTGLGLRRMHHTVRVADTPENRGMIEKVAFMLQVQEA